ncbi:MAG: hypothetical protein PHQ23_08830 [Candidatus Wallbacteria bacterium]|nr:hypothetical protein [Candidatus Wallbacteria bacterium]
METFFFYLFMAFAGMILLGGIMSLVDKYYLKGSLGAWLAVRFDYKIFMPMDQNSEVETPFMLFMALPVLIMFRIVIWPFAAVNKALDWYKAEPEDERDIDVQAKMIRKK